MAPPRLTRPQAPEKTEVQDPGPPAVTVHHLVAIPPEEKARVMTEPREAQETDQDSANRKAFFKHIRDFCFI